MSNENQMIQSRGEYERRSMEQQTNMIESKFRLMCVGEVKNGLNVRKAPSMASEVILILKRGQRVNINIAKSTSEFYYVASIVDGETKIPVHGFCKREFILE